MLRFLVQQLLAFCVLFYLSRSTSSVAAELSSFPGKQTFDKLKLWNSYRHMLAKIWIAFFKFVLNQASDGKTNMRSHLCETSGLSKSQVPCIDGELKFQSVSDISPTFPVLGGMLIRSYVSLT